MMVTNNEETNKTAYTVTVDYKHGQYLLPFNTLPPFDPRFFLCSTFSVI